MSRLLGVRFTLHESQTGRQRKAVVTYREPSSSDDEAEASDDDTDDDSPAPRARAAQGSSSGDDLADESDEETGASEGDDDEEHEQFCRKCKGAGDIICCDGEGCRASYHPGCLSPQLGAAPEGAWLCPDCASLDSMEEVERILDVRTVAPSVPTASPRSLQTYYVKFVGRSYRACRWMRRAELLATARRFPGIVARLRNFDAKGRERAYAAACAAAADDADSSLEDQENSGGMKHGVRSEWLLVERVIARRAATGDCEAEYLCKWQELDYSESTWESESSLADFASEVAAFHARGPIDASSAGATARGKRTRRHELPPFEALTTMPSCLAGGALLSYQLVGVNWLQSAHAAGTHVILADEMGLGASTCEPCCVDALTVALACFAGKTVQAISHLVMTHERARQHGTAVMPHLVVAPLSTLRNWQREFATWAPHMNTVMMTGPGASRQIIREHELFVSGKRSPPKFHVMLTSYEIAIAEGPLLSSLDWDVVCIDEGHRLRTKESRLFAELSGLHVSQRILLTGTPLQNKIDELFTLLFFLDPIKFPSADELQAQFDADTLNKEARLSELHALLKPHLLRRVKKDVLKDLPPKSEIIVRVGLSSLQRSLYKATLTKNLPALRALSSRNAPLPKLTNIMMDLRQICCHPYLKGAESDERMDQHQEHARLTEASGKLVLLARLLPALRARGHRVLIYSQFVSMLDVLEDWLRPLGMPFERIDGGVGGAQRQLRIDRFNAPGSHAFVFLLSTRAGGIGINLTSADTVILFDSDWNPHADAQAAARAHRMGQQKDVLIYRLVTRASVEERMVTAAKRKMVLEKLVVVKSDEDKRSVGGLRQAQLDDLLRYGASELFAEDADTAVVSDQWDDVAIEALLDRSSAAEEVDDESEDDMFAAFKVAHFELPAAEAPAPVPATEQTAAEAEPAPQFWDSLLGERFSAEAAAEAAALGKGQRSRKKVAYAVGEANASDEDGSDGSEFASDDSEDGSDDDEGGDGGGGGARDRGLRPLLQGDAVYGFEPRERATFVKSVMRFGIGDLSWRKHAAALGNKKSSDSIREYGALFMAHLAEPVTEGDTFSDGVPKDNLKVPDVLQRIAALELFRRKLADCSGAQLLTFSAGASLTTAAKAWSPAHDFRLVSGLLAHGFGSWRDILLDEGLNLQATLRAELGQPSVGVEREPPPSAVLVAPADGAEAAAASASPSKAAADWQASLVQGLTPAELSAQTTFIKKRLDSLRDAIHREALYQTGPPAQATAKAALPKAVLPPLSNLVVVPPDANAFTAQITEQCLALYAAAEATRADAHAAFCGGRGGDNAGSAAYASALENLEAQARSLAQALQEPAAGALPRQADDDAIVLDDVSPRPDVIALE